MFQICKGEMFLNAVQSPVGLIVISGIVLIVLSVYILKHSHVTHEGFKDSWIISEDELHATNVKRENERHLRELNTPHISTVKAKSQLKKLIKRNPHFIDEINSIMTDDVISDQIDKTIKSKPILKRVHDVIATPKITHQIEEIIQKDPSHQKLTKLESQIKHVKTDLKKEIHHDIKQIHKDIKKDIKKVQTNIQKKVDTAVKKVEVAKVKETAKKLPQDTPYQKVMRAHNKLNDQNSSLIEEKRRNLAEIKEIRKQLEKTEETQKINVRETAKLTAQAEAIHNKHLKANKELKENKLLFTALVKQNLETHEHLTEVKKSVAKDKKVCSEHSSEIRRLLVRIESTNSEKKSAEEHIEQLQEQLKAAAANESLANVIKGQIEQLEKQKVQLENSQRDLQTDLQKEMAIETEMQSKIKKTEMEIKSLENGKAKLEKKLADSDAKNKMEHEAVKALVKEIEESKNRMAVRTSTNSLLENELQNLRKQYEKLSETESGEEKQLRMLEKDSEKNKQTIAELQVVVKTLTVKPKNYPIGNWDFTKGSLKDQNNKYQSETVGDVPFDTFQGKRGALFKEQNHIKINGSISTNDFKSITMMIYVMSNPGPYPRIWEFTNSNLGGSWCSDSLFGCLDPNNNVGFYSMKDCNGPSIWCNKGNLDRGSWQHVAFVYNDNMDEMTLYKNGQKAGHWSEPGNKRFKNKTYSNLYIMQCVERFNKNAAVAWFRIFDYTMKDEDITKDMNNQWT